jgi:conjugative transfer pilus assembly protein TraH
LKCISITLVVTVITLSLNVETAKSDVAAELSDMFNSMGFTTSSSNSGAYESQSRGYMVGGGIRARTPTKYIQPLNIQLPDFKSGCGGIDMNFGGFSFINAEEFKTFLQQAGSQAVGYAFMMAIEAVCPTCRSILDTLRKMADSINKFGLDSCTAAKAAVNTAWGAMEGMMPDAFSEWGETQESWWDPYKAKIEGFSRGLDEMHAKIYEKSRDPRNPLRRGISTTENLSTSMTEEQMELAISLLGTMAPRWDISESSAEVPTAACEELMATLTVEDLMKGYRDSENPPKILTCTSGSFQNHTCERVAAVPMSTSFKGYEEMAREHLTGIMDKIQANDPMTTEQRQFVNSVNIPIMSALRTSVAAGPEVAMAVIGEITELAALAYALHVFKSYIITYKLNARKNVCGDVPRERYDRASNEFARQAEIYTRNIAMLDGVVTMLKNIENITSKGASRRLVGAMSPVSW